MRWREKGVAINDWHPTSTLSTVVAWDRHVRDVYVGMRKIDKRKWKNKEEREIK